jgi:enoyl-CoA hydratase
MTSVLVSVEAGVQTLTLDRPEKLNAMSAELVTELHAALDAVAADRACRAVVLTGAGHGFCSGADLVGGGMVPNIAGLKKTSIARRALRVLDEVILAIRDMHQPVIAAVNGAAIGGGFCLACAADIRIGSDAAYFRAAGINNGLTANELGISYLLPRQIGFSRAFDILLSGRDVDAEEAERIGLVSQLAPGDQLLERCYELADGIIGFSHIGVELTKQLLWASLDAGSLHSHMNHEGNAQLYVRMTTSNFDEKIAAWKEGRTPVYTDE